MAKLLFLFMSQGAASPGATKRVYPTERCGVKYMDAFAGEGYFKMLDTLLKNQVIDDLKIFYESNVQPGIASWVKGPSTYCEVIPEIRFVEEYIEEDTIIFVRGGFKHWHDLLLKYKGKNWLLLYAANTGREKWAWWDIVFDDILCRNEIDRHGRYWFPFIKPINEEMFFPEPEDASSRRFNGIYKYDFCIGASHVHDRKGQWRVVDGIIEYNKVYGGLFAVMPGAPRRGLKTIRMINEKLKRAKYVDMRGHVHRTELRKIFNDSKYFLHFGAHGQNDRGPLEALACGTPSVIASPKYHAPFLSQAGCDIDNPVSVAEYLHNLVRLWDPEMKVLSYKFYKEECGFNEVIIPRMALLFDMLHALQPGTLRSKHIIKNSFVPYGDI